MSFWDSDHIAGAFGPASGGYEGASRFGAFGYYAPYPYTDVLDGTLHPFPASTYSTEDHFGYAVGDPLSETTDRYGHLAPAAGAYPLYAIIVYIEGGVEQGHFENAYLHDVATGAIPPEIRDSSGALVSMPSSFPYYDDPGYPESEASSFSLFGYVMRPTALRWVHQNPDNLANRILWLEEEVRALAYSFNISTTFTGPDTPIGGDGFANGANVYSEPYAGIVLTGDGPIVCLV